MSLSLNNVKEVDQFYNLRTNIEDMFSPLQSTFSKINFSSTN